MNYAGKLDDVANLLDQLEGLEAAPPSGAPLEISLSLIEEDPNQPRRAFDSETLAELSASIRERGVLQPIGVTSADENGVHKIIFGARRFRATQLAGRTTIPALIYSARIADPYDQMIENIQRDDLSAADISAFILSRLQAGEKQKDIAQRLGKDKSYIAMYAAVCQMAAPLRNRLATSPIRAVYQLHQAWKRFPQAVEAFCMAHDSFTRAQALAFCSGLPSDKVDQSNRCTIADPSPKDALLNSLTVQSAAGAKSGQPNRTRRTPSDTAFPSLQVRSGERLGWLILESASRSGETHALVCFEDTGGIEDLPLSSLRLVGLKIATCAEDQKQRLTSSEG
jgi:ParB family chromosome partitioning protein